MTQAAPKDAKAKIIAAFGQLLAEKKQIASKVATREEEAEKEKNQALLTVASTYTIDTIVKGLADLQLEFGSIINGLTDKITTESSKLDELKRAIEVENQHYQELQQIRLVADALHIFTQEHQEKLRALQNQADTQREAIEKDKLEKRKLWQKEQQEFETVVTEQNELLTKERQQETENYQYQLERDRQIEMDEYEELERSQERELRDANQEKAKQWAEREAYLAENTAKFTENQQKIATFEEELKKAYIQAKEEAIQEANREAKVKADLIEKEWEGIQQGYQLKIQSLTAKIQRQSEQIADISTQLQTAMRQAQELAMRAFQSSANGNATTK